MKHTNIFLTFFSITVIVFFGFYTQYTFAPHADAQETYIPTATTTIVEPTKSVEVPTVAKPQVVEKKTEPKIETQINNPYPARFSAPTVGINAKILSVGLTSTGNMDTARGWENVAWYKNGPLPGQPGSAVIAGHYESGPNINGTHVPGVFEKLNQVKIGEKLYVTDGNGKKLSFTVTDMKIVDKDSQTADIFTSNGPARITVITCQGTWLPAQKTFSHRLIVTAVLSE